MSLEKITFLRDQSQESAKISKLLDKNKILFIEIHSNSRLTPCLKIPNNIYSIRGYARILNYLESLKTYKK
ncbi:MAG: hypothetical protein AABY06_03840 [Nanoarchaeota archaeon]